MKPQKISFFVCLFLGVTSYLFGQRCQVGGDFYDVALRDKLELSSKKDYIKALSRSRIEVPVVFHIVWNKEEENISEEQILSGLDALNRDFQLLNNDTSIVPELFKPLIANPNIVFKLADFDPSGHPTNGITRTETEIENVGIPPIQEGSSAPIYYTKEGGKDAWDTKRYLNVWVAAMPITFVVGYGSRPGKRIEEEDGVIVDYRHIGTTGTVRSPYNLGRTLTHEVGHYFNLIHIFGDDAMDCTKDDSVDDTPLQTSNYNECQEGIPTTCDSPDMTNNFMNWVDDECMVMFTKGQVNRMLTALMEARSGLINPSVSTNGIDKENSNLEVSLQPNPAHHHTLLRCSPKTLEYLPTYQVINLKGQIVLSGQLDQTDTILQLEFLPRGMYLINIQLKEELVIKKLVLY